MPFQSCTAEKIKPVLIHVLPPSSFKFPTFSGDMRDYKRFKELFLHFPKHLTERERFYQLVESMERESEIRKSCKDIARAWEILDEKFNDTDHLLETCLSDLENLNTYETSRGKYDLKLMEKFTELIQTFPRECWSPRYIVNCKISTDYSFCKLLEAKRLMIRFRVLSNGCTPCLFLC